MATCASPPAARISAATCSARSALRPWTISRAPSRASRLAMAMPRPLLLPVTSARLPSSSRAIPVSLVGERQTVGPHLAGGRPHPVLAVHAVLDALIAAEATIRFAHRPAERDQRLAGGGG